MTKVNEIQSRYSYQFKQRFTYLRLFKNAEYNYDN